MHVDDLRAQFAELCPDGEAFTLKRQFEPEQNAFVWRIDRVVQVPADWSLIIGDAVHNFRGALDHLAWQLAIRYFNGVTPTRRQEIKIIQFPIVANEHDWPQHPHRKYMTGDDADKLERFQPFKLTPQQRATNTLHVLDSFAGFGGISNVDKHRTIQLAFLSVLHTTMTNNPRYCNCMPLLVNGVSQFYMNAGVGESPHENDEVLRIPLAYVGPNPDVELHPSFTAYIAIRERWDAIKVLDACEEAVTAILSEFGPRP